MENIVVIEICDRAICSVTPCDSTEEAIETANELLRIHCNTTGHGDELDEALEEAEEQNVEAGGISFALASEENSNAWCNYGDFNWDAFIVEY